MFTQKLDGQRPSEDSNFKERDLFSDRLVKSDDKVQKTTEPMDFKRQGGKFPNPYPSFPPTQRTTLLPIGLTFGPTRRPTTPRPRSPIRLRPRPRPG